MTGRGAHHGGPEAAFFSLRGEEGPPLGLRSGVVAWRVSSGRSGGKFVWSLSSTSSRCRGRSVWLHSLGARTSAAAALYWMRVSATLALSVSSARSNDSARPDLSCSLHWSSCVRIIVGSPHDTASLTASIVFSTSESSDVRIRISRSFPALTSSEVEKKVSCGTCIAPRGFSPRTQTSLSTLMYRAGVHSLGRLRPKDLHSSSSALAASSPRRRSSLLSQQSRMCLAAPPESTKTTTGRSCSRHAFTVSSVLGPPPTTSSTIGGVGSGEPSSSTPNEVVQMQVSNMLRSAISFPNAEEPSAPVSTSTKCEWLGSSATRCSAASNFAPSFVLPL